MQEAIKAFLQTLSANPGAVYVVIGLVSFGEAFAFVGYLVPGAVFMFTAGFLAFQGYFSITGAIAGAVIGGILADFGSFWLARTFGLRITRTRLFARYESSYRRGESFFRRHGGKSVVFGRFIGFTRPVVPFLAGMLGMGRIRFVTYAVVAGIIWGYLYLGTGYVFGASWGLVQAWTGRLGAVLLVVIVLIIILRWIILRLGGMAGRMLSRLTDRIDRWAVRIVETPAASRLTRGNARFMGFIARRFDPRETTGLILTFGVGAGVLAAGGLAWILFDFILGGAVSRVDAAVLSASGQLHTRISDEFFILITTLGGPVSIAVITLGCAFGLVLYGRALGASALSLGIIGGGVFIKLVKMLIDRPRPDSMFTYPLPESAAFPSAHAFMSALLAGLVIGIIINRVKNGYVRLSASVGVIVLAFLVGVSRLYLGVHWFTDVIGGWFAAVVWIVITLVFHRILLRYGQDDSPLISRVWLRRSALAVVAVSAVCIVSVYAVTRAVDVADRVRMRNPEPVSVSMDARDIIGTAVPRNTTSLLGDPAVPLAGVFRGTPPEFADLLETAGLTAASQVRIGALPELMLPGASQNTYAVVYVWRGTAPEGTFVYRQTADAFPRLVIRFWAAGVESPTGALTVFTTDRETGRNRTVGMLRLPVPEVDANLPDARRMFHDMMDAAGAAVSTFDAGGARTGQTIMNDEWMNDGVMLDIHAPMGE